MITSRYLFIALFFIGLVLLVSVINLAALSATYFLVGILFLLVMAPVFIIRKSEIVDYFEPIVFVGAMYFIYFGIRTLYVLNAADQEKVLQNIPYFFDVIDKALVYVIIGFGCLLLGYYSPIAGWICDRLPRIKPIPVSQKSTMAAYGLFSAGTICQLILISLGRYNMQQWEMWVKEMGYQQPLYERVVSYLTVLVLFGFALGMAHHFSKSKASISRFALLFMLAMQLLWMWLVGSKTILLHVFTVIAVSWNYLNRRISLKQIIIGAMAVIILMFSLAYSRETLGKSVFRLYHPLESLVYMGSSTYESLKEDGAEGLFGNVMARIHGIDSFSLIVKYTNYDNLRWGRTLLAAPLQALIPQFLWPDKDVVLGSLIGGEEFARDYFLYEASKGGIGITQIGELYMNFLLPGVMFGMMIYGIFYRLMYLYFVRKNGHSGAIFIYSVIFLWMTMIEFWFFHWVGNFVKYLLILLGILWFVNSGRLLSKDSDTAV